MNTKAKKTLLRDIPYGVYVIGVKSGKNLHAFTGTWLSQCSLKPPCVMMGVRKNSYALELLQEGQVFSVNFLKKEEKPIAEVFFQAPKPSKNAFGKVKFKLGVTGSPLLDDAVGHLECEVKSITDNYGDHAVVVGQVIAAELLSDEPSLLLSDTTWNYGG